MNLAAILPGFLQADSPLRHTRSPGQTSAAVLPGRCTMTRNAIMELENKPLRLGVLSGCVWITRDGCPADKVLEPGDFFEQRLGARVLVQALEEAELMIAAVGAHGHNA